MKKLTKILLAAFAAGTVQVVSAVNYSPSDLLLVFRESGYSDVEFDIGSVSNYVGQAAGIPIPISYNTSAVTTNFNNTLSGVSFGVVGATSVSDSRPRVWLADADLVSSPGDLTVNTYSTLESKIDSVGSIARSLTGHDGNALFIDPSNPNSYSSIVSPDDIDNISTMGGDAPFVVDAVNPASLALYEMVPTATSPTPLAVKLGTFAMGGDGTISFTPSAVTPVITGTTDPNTTSRGGTAAFGVTTEGATGYQWYDNGVAIAGATNATLSLTNVQPQNVGDYSVVVSNSIYGTSVTSSGAPLAVTPAYLAGDLQLIFREPGYDDVEFDLGSVSNYLGRTLGSHVPISYNKSLVSANFNNSLAGVSFGLVAGVSVSDSSPRVWLSDAVDLSSAPEDLTVNTYATLDSKVSGVGQAAAAVNHTISFDNPVILDPSDTRSYSYIVSPGDTADISSMGGDAPFTVDAVNPATLGVYELAPSGAPTPPAASLVGAVQMGADGSLNFIAGAIPPVITTQPGSETNGTRNTATFTVTAAGSALLNYQWFKDATNAVLNATNSSLVISNLQVADAGAYSVLISNAGGSITSSVATLTMFVCPDITVSPAIALLPYGHVGTAYSQTFGASGSPAGPYTYSEVGSLPAGLGLTNGVLSGTPAALGTNDFTVKAMDTNGCFGVTTYEVRIAPPCSDVVAPVAPVFTFPKLGKTVFGAGSPVPVANPVVVAGTTVDETKVSDVLVSLNGGGYHLAGIIAGSKPVKAAWTNSLNLRAGTNVISIVSVDACGNSSVAATNTFLYAVGVPLTIVTNGHGSTVSKSAPASPLFYNEQPVIITALADNAKPSPALNLFSNWVLWSNNVQIATSATAKGFTFVMQSNLTLDVNFVTNYFIAAAGNYTGFYSDTNTGVTLTNAGLVTFKPTPKGAYSGTFYSRGVKTGFAGTFDLLGNGTLTVKGTPANIVMTMKMDLTGTNGNNITGSISNTANLWSSDLIADKAYDSLNPPPAGLLNTYTMVVPGQPGGGSVVPAGDGFLVFSVTGKGTMKLVEGTMGDGSKGALGAGMVGLNGLYPLYAPLNKDTGGVYHGLAMGWVTVTTTNVYCPSLVWMKEAAGALVPATYPLGFSTNVATTNSIFTGPLTITRATMAFADGGVFPTVTSTNFTYVDPAFVPDNVKSNKLQFAIALKADGKGGAKGSFETLANTKASAVKGAGGILGGAGAGGQVRGCFISTDGTETGSVLIRQYQPGDPSIF